MLGHGEQFDVRVAHVHRVGDEVLGEFAVGVEAPVGVPSPGPEVHLVGIERGVQPVALRSRVQPAGVLPCMPARAFHAGGGAGAQFGQARIRVGLHEHGARGPVADLELVERARRDPRHEQLPHAARAAARHGMGPAVPAVEVAHDTHAFGAGCPAGEPRAGDAVANALQGAQHLPAPGEPAFVEQVEILVADLGRKGPRTGDLAGAVEAVGDGEGQGTREGAGQRQLEQRPRRAAQGQPFAPDAHAHGLRRRIHMTDETARGGRVDAEHGVGVVQSAFDQSLERRIVHRGLMARRAVATRQVL